MGATALSANQDYLPDGRVVIHRSEFGNRRSNRRVYLGPLLRGGVEYPSFVLQTRSTAGRSAEHNDLASSDRYHRMAVERRRSAGPTEFLPGIVCWIIEPGVPCGRSSDQSSIDHDRVSRGIVSGCALLNPTRRARSSTVAAKFGPNALPPTAIELIQVTDSAINAIAGSSAHLSGSEPSPQHVASRIPRYPMVRMAVSGCVRGIGRSS